MFQAADGRVELTAPVSPRRAKSERVGRRTFWIGTIATLIAAGGAIAISTGNLGPAFDLDDIAAMVGLSIRRVIVQGNRFTSREDVVAALGLATNATQVSVDTSAARTQIEQLPWVARAVVHREFPDGLAIEITERQPYAILRRDDADFLIDGSGKLLSRVPQHGAMGLPVVEGEGAGEAASSIIDLIRRYPALGARLAKAERIDRRRWTLHLNSGNRIFLPAVGEQSALDRLIRPQFATILDGMPADLDLRLVGEVVLSRPVGPRVGER